MKRLIYQVAVGKPSGLYNHCINSVADYSKRLDVDHLVQREPELRIRPNPGRSGRSREAVERYGYLPIFEKEVAFRYLGTYDQIAVIDADIYVRPGTNENIFSQLGDKAFCAMPEMNLPMKSWYTKKLQGYSRMQYGRIWERRKFSNQIAPFCNMGVMLFSKDIAKYMPCDNSGVPLPKKFIEQKKFRDFVDGIGNFKWSTDQTLLNHWIYDMDIPFSGLDWKWNCLYTTVEKKDLLEAHAVHFFLKDKLPNRGENIEQLMKDIN